MTAIDDIRTSVKNAVGLIQSQASQIGAVSSHVETLFKENAELKAALSDANTQIATLKTASTTPVDGISEVELQDLANQLKSAVEPSPASIA
jgi:hypothetical protein